MPSFTIKKIPDQLLDRLRERASRSHRSLNSEILHLLEESTQKTAIDPADWLTSADKLRAELDLSPLNEVILNELKSAGRP